MARKLSEIFDYLYCMVQVRELRIVSLRIVFSSEPYNKAKIFLGLIEYELDSLLDASHLLDYTGVHI